MSKYLIPYCLLLMPVFAMAQDVFVTKADSKHLGKAIEIDYGCGISGHTSPEIQIVKDLIKNNQDEGIAKLVGSDDKLMQLLAIIAVDNIIKNRKIALSDSQKVIMAAYKLKMDEVGVCEGWTYYSSSTVRKIFNDPKSDVRLMINSVLGQYHSHGDFESKSEANNTYRDGLKEGKWVEYVIVKTDTGSMDTVEYYLTVYKAGEPFGTVKGYYSDGFLKRETPYSYGKKNGTEVYYFRNGKTMAEHQYRDDQKNGIDREYYENGNLKKEMPYVNSQENGQLKVYDSTGTLDKEVPYINGKKNGVLKTYYAGKLEFEIPYTDDKINGATKHYDENGNEIK